MFGVFFQYRAYAHLLAGFHFIAHIDLRSGVVTHQDDRQARGGALADKRLGARRKIHSHLLGQGVAIYQLCRHEKTHKKSPQKKRAVREIDSNFGSLTQRSFQQIGDGIGIELFHDVGSMCFNGFDADAQVIGNLLV